MDVEAPPLLGHVPRGVLIPDPIFLVEALSGATTTRKVTAHPTVGAVTA